MPCRQPIPRSIRSLVHNPVCRTRHRTKNSAEIMDNTFAFIIAAALVLFFLLNYLRKQKKIEVEARAAEEKGKLHSSGPQFQHPQIDANYCIGCVARTMVC